MLAMEGESWYDRNMCKHISQYWYHTVMLHGWYLPVFAPAKPNSAGLM